MIKLPPLEPLQLYVPLVDPQIYGLLYLAIYPLEEKKMVVGYRQFVRKRGKKQEGVESVPSFITTAVALTKSTQQSQLSMQDRIALEKARAKAEWTLNAKKTYSR